MHQQVATSVTANTTGAIVTSVVGKTQVREYFFALYNPASIGGVTAYITTTAAETGPNALSIPPKHRAWSGPYTTLPYLYGASSQAITVQTFWSDKPTGLPFEHTIENTEVAYKLAGAAAEFTKAITAAANAGSTTLATVAGGSVRILGITVVANGANADLTSAAVKGGASAVNVFISATEAAKANLDADDEQVYWDGGNAGFIMEAADTIITDLQGGGATAVALNYYIRYSPCTDGAYIA